MSNEVRTVDVGIITAYGYAVAGGYTGTVEQFAAGLAASAQSAANAGASATAAAASEQNAQAWAEGKKGSTDVGSDADQYQNNAKYYKGRAEHFAGVAETKAGEASTSASGASASEQNAQAWAEGKKGSTDVGSDAPQYHNSAKYHADNAYAFAQAAEEFADEAEETLESAVLTVKITDTSITMGDISSQLDTINTNGQHVYFDLAAFGAKMYLCTIYIDAGFYRIHDAVTGFEKKGFFKNTDLLVDILKGGSSSVGKHYTVQWDKTNAACTRLNDAANITTTTTHFGHFGSVDASYSNPFDDIYPWSGRKLCNIDIDAYRALTTGDDITECVTYWEDDEGFSYNDANGVWVYTPSFFGRSFEAGNYMYFDVSDEPTQDNIAYPASISGRWQGRDVTLTINGTSKHCLIPSVGMPAKNIAMSTLHTYAKNWSATLDDVYSADATTLLFIVEFATLNSQNALGAGCTDLYRQNSSDKIKAAATSSTVVKIAASAASYVIPNAIFDIGTSSGSANVASCLVVSKETDSEDNTLVNVTLDTAVTVTTDHYWSIHGLGNVADEDIGSKSGYIGTSGRCNTYYRGQVIFGNLWFYVLGLYRQTGTGKIWLCPKDTTDNYDGLNTSAHIDTGVAVTAGVANYIGTVSRLTGLSVPYGTNSGGNSSNPIGDYMYTPSAATANTVLLLGGCAGIGAIAGRFSAHLYNDASFAHWSISARPRLRNP